MSRRPLVLLGLALGLAVLAGGGLAAANAVAATAPGSIHACTRKGGGLRIVASPDVVQEDRAAR